MEFIEEESRPRFLFQSRASPSSVQKPETLKIDKLHLAACFSAAALLLFFAFSSFSQSQTLNFILVWTSLSLLIAPFAPSSVTGGDVRVGRGELLQPSDATPPPPDDSKKRIPGRRIRSWKPETTCSVDPPVPATTVRSNVDPIRNGNGSAKEERVEEPDGVEGEWTDEDFDILKKQISKHPVGEPRRWEKIAEAFGGRHGLESVIKTAKSLSERRPGARDSFAEFLKQRKPLDKRAEAVDGEPNGLQIPVERENGGGSVVWTSGEDIALLNALKVFSKDVSMRWEKIAAAVPGKSKACCMKRVTELKRDFRNSKASES